MTASPVMLIAVMDVTPSSSGRPRRVGSGMVISVDSGSALVVCSLNSSSYTDDGYGATDVGPRNSWV